MIEFKVGQKYILTHGFFGTDKSRIGEEVTVIEWIDEKGLPYLAFKDRLGVSVPVKEHYIK